MRKTLLWMLAMLMALPVFSQGLTPQKDENKNLWGYVDSTGKWVIKPKFEEADSFAMRPNGKQRAFVKEKGKIGIIDETGKALGQGIAFDGVSAPEQLDVVGVIVKGKTGTVNYDGQYIIKPEWETLSLFLDGDIFIAKAGDKIQVLGSDGKIIKKFNGWDSFYAIESSDMSALLIFMDAESQYLYKKDKGLVKKVMLHRMNIGGFTKDLILEEINGEWAIACDAIFSDKIIHTNGNFFVTPKGEPTKYQAGGEINDWLFYMSDNITNEGPFDLFKVGESEPIGKIAKLPEESYSREDGVYFKLIDDSYINGAGDPIEPIFKPGARDRDGKLYDVRAYKNLKTGKYGVVDTDILKYYGVDVSDYRKKLTPEEYEIFDFVDFGKTYRLAGESVGWLVIRNGKPQLFDEYENPVSSTVNGEIDIRKYNGGYTVFINDTGKFGLKHNNEVVVNNEYDGIFSLNSYDGHDSYVTDYFKLYKNGKCALYNKKTNQIVIPFDKGFTTVGGTEKSLNIRKEIYDSGLIFTQIGEDEDPNKALGMWSLTAGKELIKPAKDNNFGSLPTGYKGYSLNGEIYTPEGKVMKLAPAVDVYQSDWANEAPYYFVKFAGLKGRPIEFQLTIYNENGSVYVGRDGQKCIYTFSKVVTPDTECEYGPEITFYLGNDIYIPKFSKRTLKFVLSARDAKTKAAIPVKGEKSYARWFERTW